ncbi:MAG: Transcriptional regulator, TetR family protein [Myxococcales bacterium]|nr:Transcriptional regulator, TetR family protein [Myxococcales bacterium]
MARYGEKADGRVARAQKAREQRRTAVLAVARRIFADKGYHATSIDDIIAAAGIARGTFYLYFESKRAIFDELLDELFTTLQAQVRRIEVGPNALPPVEQMNATVDRVMQTLAENREVPRILLREAVGIDDEFDAKLEQFYGRIEALLTSAVLTGQQMNLVRPCDAGMVARCILGSAKELVHWAFVKQEPDALDLGHLGRELISFTLKGLFQ